ncbi:MAG: hypothetical protein K2N44_10230 [Lachnospiraceae bacterium]|nr:hypothetical protein [Lachnospiraceae bacterium]
MKAVLAIVIGEQVMRMLPKGDGFLHSRKTFDLCWKCIEEWENVADDVMGDICYCIDPEDDIEFQYYSDISEDATISNIYMLLLGIASYIDAQVMMEVNSALPPYIDPVSNDEGYTKFILDYTRACLKNAFCQMCVTICGRFVPNEGGVAGYVN